VRNLITVHNVMPASFTHQAHFSNQPIWLIPSIHKQTGTFAFLQAPVIIGSPSAIFRDMPEYIPYMPSVIGTLVDATGSQQNNVGVMCNTQQIR